jgi:hypothetical protein
MNIEQSDQTVTFTLNKRHLVIALIIGFAIASIMIAILGVPKVFSISNSSISSGSNTQNSHLNHYVSAQTTDCISPVMQLTQVLTFFTRFSTVAISNAISAQSDTPLYGDIIADFSGTYILRGITTARDINSEGCPTEGEETNQFEPTDRIYLVVENSDFSSGTALFARLYFEGQAIEDTSEIVADQDYVNTCVNLWFESENRLEPGEYTIELFINGNSVTEVTFEVE